MSQIDPQSGARTYSITPEQIAHIQKQMLIRSAVIWGVVSLGLVGLLAYFMRSDQSDLPIPMFLIFGCPMVAILAVFSVGGTAFWYMMLKRQLEAYHVSLTDDTLTVSGWGINPVTLHRDEIAELSESKRYGMIVRTRNPYHIPFISPKIEDYQTIRETLIGWHPLDEKNRGFNLPTFQWIVALAGVPLIMLVPNIYVVVSAWLVICGFQAYLIYFVLKGPELKSGVKAFGVGSHVVFIVVISMGALSSILRIVLNSRGIQP